MNALPVPRSLQEKLDKLVERYAELWRVSQRDARRLVEQAIIKRGLESLQKEIDG